MTNIINEESKDIDGPSEQTMLSSLSNKSGKVDSSFALYDITIEEIDITKLIEARHES